MKKTLINLAIAFCFAIGTTLPQADPLEDHGNIIEKKSDTSKGSNITGISGGMSASDTLGVTDPSGSTRVIDPSGIPGVMGLPGTSGGMDPSDTFGGTVSSRSSSRSAVGAGHAPQR